jgi:hypothetical protein
MSHRPATTPNASNNYLHTSHSTSLISHRIEVPELEHTRSYNVLPSRATAYPKYTPDVSKELINETIGRRTIHNRLLTADSSAFRMKSIGESTSDYFYQKHIIRDYLNTLHPLYDPDNIGGKKYNVSRIKLLKENDKYDGESAVVSCRKMLNKDDRLKTSQKVGCEDFVRPEDPLSTKFRDTGYSSGHVRSKLGLDTYGPSSSNERAFDRASRLIPQSPNIDRERTFSSYNNGSATRSRLSSLETGSNSSIGFSVNDFFPNQTGNVGKSKFSPGGDGSTSNSVTSKGNTKRSKDLPPGTLGFTGPAILNDDISLVDPITKNKEWSRSYFERKASQKKEALDRKLRIADIRRQREDAKAEQQAIISFESSLQSKVMKV